MTDRDRPSEHGKLLGEALADLAKAGAVGTELLDLMCATCAFREGCMTNQMAATGKDALDCVIGADDSDFGCHHGMKDGQPTKLCAGWLAAKRAPFPVLQSTLLTLAARLEGLTGEDAVRAEFDAWAAAADPDGKMDNYQWARKRARDGVSEAEAAA